VRANDVTVTAAQKIIKNSNHSYVRNVLHIKLVQESHAVAGNPRDAAVIFDP